MASSVEHNILPRPEFDAPVKVLIVQAPYYAGVAEGLLAGCTAELEAIGADYEVIDVPGALEIPTAIGIAHKQSNFDAYVALGCVVRGGTTHYETVCEESNRGLTMLGLSGACIGNAILTCENMEQAEVRADPAGMNKGAGAAAAALHLLALQRRFGKPARGIGFKPAGSFDIA